mmetsp:Transcript_6230/g.9110  ORF Transcript_6230/g.9110 Transcript_6230/m.9110 type:complete len:294 (+) Transcript_6230:60-941(+)
MTTKTLHHASFDALRILCNADTNILKKLLGDESLSSTTAGDASFWSPDAVQINDQGHVIQLDLSGRRVKNLPREAFVLLKELRTLNLGGTDVPVSQLLSVLDECCFQSACVQQVYLGGNGLGDVGLKAISDLFLSSSLCSIIKLDLRYNDIGHRGAAAISAALVSSADKKCCCLKYLYMEGNQLGDAGASALAGALEDPNSTVQELFLGANQIGPQGAASLSQALLTNTSLSKLYLEGNCIGPDGAACFTLALEKIGGNSALKHLYVDNNRIGKEECMSLARALQGDSVIGDL